MKRYEARPERGGWAVYDSVTRETLSVPQDQDEGGAQAYSALLNDLESIGRVPPAERRRA